jgi:uracil-DNA glycosylase
LCFSVNKGIDYPPSLKNIFKEIQNNFGLERINPDFSDLAKQGVLLLNSVLTVRRKFPGSHKYVGWETFTDKVLEIISEKKDNLVFMLWGNYAKNKKKFILNKNHLILESGHPSPLSANKGYWFNNNHFSMCNDYLYKNNIEKIKWV